MRSISRYFALAIATLILAATTTVTYPTRSPDRGNLKSLISICVDYLNPSQEYNLKTELHPSSQEKVSDTNGV